MKKIGLLSIFVLSLCFLAGCDNTVNNEEEISNNTNEVVNESNDVITEESEDDIRAFEWKAWYQELIALYKKEGKVTCEMEGEDTELGTITSTLYIDGEKSYQEAKISADGESLTVYTLTRDGKTYSRWDLYDMLWDWVGFITEIQGTMEEQLNSNYNKDDDNTKINCKAGVKWVNFDVPSDINFMSEKDFLG